MNFIFRILFCLASIGLCSCAEAAAKPYDPVALYLTWQRSPESTMYLCWLTKPDRTDDTVEYRKAEGEWAAADGTHRPLPENTPYLLHQTELTALEPNTLYEFRTGKDAVIYKFRTMPAALDASLRFVAGGDFYHDKVEVLRKTNRQAAKTSPAFVLVGGDIAYASDKLADFIPRWLHPLLDHFARQKFDRWLTWLIAWKEDMVTPEGCLIPMLPAIGNHDTMGRFGQTPEQAPFFYSLFPMPGLPGYNVLDFGDYLSIFLLDSGHTNPVGGEQAEWLAQALEQRQVVPYKFAVYHVPAYPSVHHLTEKIGSEIRKFWVPSFEAWNLTAAFENHEHAYKRTYPLADGKVVEHGVVYLGDGGWGVENPRHPRHVNEKPYLAKAASSRNFIVADLDKDKTTIHALDANGTILDSYSMAKTMLNEEDRPEKVAAGQIPDEMMNVADAADPTMRRPAGVIVINQVNGQLNVTSNMPDARWTLLKNSISLFEGRGTLLNFQTVAGNNYVLIPEEVEGFVVKVTPSSSFTIFPGQSLNASIVYERTVGFVVMQAPFPDGESITFILKPREGSPSTFKIKSQGGKIFWQSPSLPTGPYEVLYILPPNYQAIPADKIFIKRGEMVRLFPQLFTKGVLRVVANVPEAVFLLRTLNETKVWKGEGREYTFTDIPPGKYLLSFSTQDPDYFIPPQEMKVTLNKKETKEVKVLFQIASKLIIRTNIDRSQAIIQEIGKEKKNYQENILNHSGVFSLPEGHYRVSLASLPEDSGTTADLLPPDPVEVTLKALVSEELNLNFRINTAPHEKQRRLGVSAGISGAGFTIYKLSTVGEKQWIGHYSGKNTQVTLPPADSYEIVYDEVPNYKTPESATIEIQPGEAKSLQGNYLPILSFAEIPEGSAIIGDASSTAKINELPAKVVTISAFSIGVYLVTNAEFASWLNNAVNEGSLSYIQEADKRGQVVNKKGQLLFKTFEADSYSQISAQLQSTGTPLFMPLAGKDSYPVINVTWHGAQEYCKENHFRLPTEAEWEKAAGMERQEAGAPLKKYRFGFGQNEIDRTWANYKADDDRIQHFQVLTTPVGFYNGVNQLPLTAHQNRQEKTHLARSPYGAFDMSGNVWEWTADWFDESYTANLSDNDPQGPSSGTLKVVKGGCYDSLADGVRVTERLGIPPDYCDAYTGFRIAK